MTYRFLSAAEQDLSDAVAYYEGAVPGLGLEFVDEVERTVQRILQQPEAWLESPSIIVGVGLDGFLMG